MIGFKHIFILLLTYLLVVCEKTVCRVYSVCTPLQSPTTCSSNSLTLTIQRVTCKYNFENNILIVGILKIIRNTFCYIYIVKFKCLSLSESWLARGETMKLTSLPKYLSQFWRNTGQDFETYEISLYYYPRENIRVAVVGK